MRRLLLVFSFFLILSPIIQSHAQTTASYHKKWLFGMNWGGAWENADVHSRLGTGWGLTLEKEIIANNTSLLGFSLRGRYLHTWMWGRESSPFYGVNNDDNLNGVANSSVDYTSAGYVYRNFYTKTDEFSLEGLLILNRLRANSGFKIYGFGGIGATGYLSKINQLDGTNNMYDYSGVSTFSKGTAKNDLNNLWDKTYETNAGQNKSSYVLSGAIGVGIGIKLSPNVYLGWEHKYTYTSTDNLDASNWKIDATKSLKNDRYHYSSLFLTVAIGSGSSHVERTPQQTTYYPTPAVDNKPVITLLFPHENPVYLQECVAVIKVSITNVTSVNQITVLRDGNVLSSSFYSFDDETQVLAIHTPIAGNSIFSIVAQNSSGKDTKYVYTNCSPVLNAPASVAPIVSIVSSSSTNCIANVVASVKNVTDPKSIEVIMDGIILSSQQYHFNPYNGSVVVEAAFNQFTSITIRATSSGNSAVQTVNLSCTPVTTPANTKVVPVINIITSNVDKDNGGNCTAKITAFVSGVSSVSTISITRNGSIMNPQDYSFDAATGTLTMHSFIFGSNTFIIKASNSAGVTTASVKSDCVNQNVPKLPSIQLVQPSTSVYSSATCREHVAIKVFEVTDIQNINVEVNGVAISKSLMRFDVKTSLLTFDALITKQTIVTISATNKDGTATEKLTIDCAPVFAPTILIVSPAVDPFVSTTCQETVVATVTDVTDINSIHVTLNGIVLTTGLSYDPASDKLSFPVNVSGRAEILINAVGKGGSSSKSFTIICQPAPKPVITVISPTTEPYVSSACQEQISVQIQNILSVSNVAVTLNGVPLAGNVLNYNATTGMLVFPVQFTGTASVVLKATNVNGITLQTITLQCKPIILPKPVIRLITPVAVSTISKTCRESVKLKLTNCASVTDISVLENGVAVRSDLLNYSSVTGVLTFEVAVAATSTIVVSAKNNGGTTSTTLTIQCKPTIMPSVSILEPVGTPVISTECLENIKAVVKNVTSLDQIEVTYNGTSVNRSLLFYDTLTSVLTFSHAFRTNGDLIIKASNETGQDSKTVSLVCQPVLLPELVIINPKQDPYASENCKDTIVATVKNIESINDIMASANAIAIPASSISFDKTSGLIKVIVSYAVSTEVKLTVKNSAGIVFKTIHLTCNPILQPAITLINPTAETYASLTCQENILMNVVNISAKDQIEVKVNAVVLSPTLYTFDASTGLLTIPATFTAATKIAVVATNKAKTATKIVNLTCNKVPAPTVVINTPAAETAVITNCNTTVKATVTNVTAKEQLIITNNGIAVNASAYSFINGIVTLGANVAERAAINITATNTTGAASDNTTLICDAPKVIVGPTGNTCAISTTPITNCTACNDTIKVSSGDITVNANQKVCVPNSFTGNVNMNGGQLVICGNATIRNINFNSGDIVITGNVTFDNLNMNNSASAIRNYGTVKFSNITFNGRFENHGQATISSDFNVNSSAVFINTGTLNATMNFNNNNFVCNSGTITVGGNLKDNGSAEFTNSCKLNVSGQLHIDKTFTNSGVVSVATTTFVNGSGKLTMGTSSKWLTTDIVINGSIAGPSGNCALIQIKNDTRINSSASLTGKLDVCDVNGIELQTGSIASSITTNCSCSINTSSACSTSEDVNAQITICHNPNGSSANPQTITISKSALATHLAHGDHIGSCTSADTPPVTENPVETTPVVVPPVVVPVTPPVVVPPVETTPTQTTPVEEEKVTICHKPPGNPTNVQTIEVAKSALSAHLAHGDHVGACTNADMPVQQQPEVVTPPVVVPVTPPVVVPPVETTPTQTTPVEEEKVTICHKPPGNPTNVQTIEIAKSALASHLAHGDHVGACTSADMAPVEEEKVTICHKPPGNPTNVQTIEIAKSALASHLAHGDHVGACTSADTAPVEEEKVTICHKPPGNPTNVQTIEIAKSALASHLAHGDHVGACTSADTAPVEEEKVTICHKPPGNPTNVQTIEIAKSALASHLAHGDHVGECTNADMPVQATPTQPTTPPVEEGKIMICHRPPGNPTNVQTIEIAKSALASHLAHGDHIGGCTNADMPAQQTPVQETPPTTTTPATTPPVQETTPAQTTTPTTPAPAATVVICHTKADGSKVTITVEKSEVAKHRAHGDHVGACTSADTAPIKTNPVPQEDMVTICHKKQDGTKETLTVPQSQLQKHLDHGDHVGVCTPDEMNGQ